MMMGTIYVAGPVIRPGLANRRFRSVFHDVVTAADATGEKVVLPELDRSLDRLKPPDFVKLISDRIASADGVLTVLTEGDQSAPVEATLAAICQKPQLVLAKNTKRVPRMIRGLPFVVDVVKFGDRPKLVQGIRKLSKQYSGG
ncbi:MAG: hypothetical protein HY709_11355 [Candidatus Latescibacteria bacterium]|nr:hypothetical protein [Candidatus Latescibacterota bacterium]